jgi:uncharacterized surface protein with fasciclin (FAS1) repeats
VTDSLLRRCALFGAVGALTVVLGACGGNEPAESTATDSGASTTAPVESGPAPVSDEPFGAGCSAVPADGEGSFAGMADDPLGLAAAHTPALSTLVQAVNAANLGPSLDSQQDVTLLAPANPAFEAVPADALQALLADSARLTAVLTHHLIAGRLSPEELAGTHTTLNNDELTIEGEGETFTVAGGGTLTGTPATVVCGNVQTANATVYLIDQVLAPAA